MAKHALSLFIKIALFAAIMLIVAKVTPYDGLVDHIEGFFDFESASKFTGFILGEPDLEAWESLHDYFCILINTLISVPILGIFITTYNGITKKITPKCLLKDWAVATIRRFAKIFAFTLLFWALFRFLPYQSIFPDGETYSGLITVAVVAINLLLTIICYWLITTKITTKRSS